MVADNTSQIVELINQLDKKELLNYLRKIVVENAQNPSPTALVWKGWLFALEKEEASSLFFTLVNGASPEEVSYHIQEFIRIRDMVLEQDPVSGAQQSEYFDEWLKFLNLYKDRLPYRKQPAEPPQ